MFRDADTIELHSSALARKMWNRVQPLLQLESLLIAREEDDEDGNRDPRWERDLFGSWQPSALNPDMLFAKYPSFGSFAPHTDGRAIETFNSRSFYSVIVYLNTIPAPGGGGTRFYSFDAVQRLRSAAGASGSKAWTSDPTLVLAEVHPVAGRMLVFEQSLVHEGVPPVHPHLKYIIRSDVMFQRNPAICDLPQDVAAYSLLMKVSWESDYDPSRVDCDLLAFPLTSLTLPPQAEAMAGSGQEADAAPIFRRAIKMSPALARILGHG